MKEMFISLGLAFLFGIAALIVTFFFLEGWGTIATIVVNALAFLIAGYFMGKIKPKSILYNGLVIVLPLCIFFISDIHYFNDLFNILSNPSKIDKRDVYVLLPIIALVSAYTGSYIGKRWHY
jgi:predicted MPP superfamily phosphohydrolase